MSSNKFTPECQNEASTHHGSLGYCSGCELVYCDDCYNSLTIHKKRAKNHEKTDLDTASFVLSLFDPDNTPQEREKQHKDNIRSKWFGTSIDDQESRSYFHDFGGFLRLLQGSELPADKQFPSLISFVGETGSGKSTLVNAILKIQIPVQITGGPPADTLYPVIGASSEQSNSTSGDVHLFSDPGTRDTSYPTFYADCEGFDGTTVPAAAKCLTDLGSVSGWGEIIHKQRAISPPITRRWAVRELYPRILFPFSDVICYVTTNPRTFEYHLERLLLWANRAIDKTTNQPMLPQAFLIINTVKVKDSHSPRDHFQDWWDVDKVTAHFLETPQRFIKEPFSKIGNLASDWTKRGHNIKSLGDLIKCYYSNFKIICIPDARYYRYSLIIAQYRLLKGLLRVAAESCRKFRKDSGFLMSSQKLGGYIEMAFDHFTTTPKRAFNFLSAALFRSPVTQSFKDHICKLAVRYMRVYPKKNGADIFLDLAIWVASCIFLHSHRLELPNSDIADAMFHQYQSLCMAAQTEFYDRSWPCEATDKKGNRCVNIRSTHHAKGHQNSTGRIFFAKDSQFKIKFKSSFDTENDMQQANSSFSRDILCQLERCIQEYKQLIDPEEPYYEILKEVAASIHISKLQSFRDEGFMKGLISHQTCFCCLASSPAHKLRCGHVICRNCLEDYSEKEERHVFCRVIKACPLCGGLGKLKFEMKPPTAGLRILCLDGGGTRSIIQLEILKELERVIGLGIPIRNLFDLVVGTSCGGIVAVGIGLKHPNMDQSIDMFKELTEKAFKRRRGSRIPLFGKVIVAHYHSLYETAPIEEVLQDFFGHDAIFGAVVDVRTSTVPGLKVAVTATSSSRRALLLANYNRPPLERRSARNSILGYEDVQDEEEEEEVEVDEVDRSSKESDNINNKEGQDEESQKDEEDEEDEEDGRFEECNGGQNELLKVDEKEEQRSSIQADESSGRVKDPRASEMVINEIRPIYTEDSIKDESTRGVESKNSGHHNKRELYKERSNSTGGDSTSGSSIVSFGEINDTRSSYIFFRGEDEETELNLWETLRATAAPGYFKSYLHPTTQYAFDDGAIRCNNPVFVADKERKMLWPELSDQDPDILLSIGTGFDPAPSTPAEVIPKRGIQGFLQKVIRMGEGAILEDMNCEALWQEFTEGFGTDENAKRKLKRYKRLNLPLQAPIPALDAVNEIENLQKLAKDYISSSGGPDIKRVADALIGSLFYFELEDVYLRSSSDEEVPQREPNLTCVGRIKCRLVSEALVERMGGRRRNLRKDMFLIGENDGHMRRLKLIKCSYTGKMWFDVQFKLKSHDREKQICMFLSLEDDPTRAIRISGFPRPLFAEAHALCTRECDPRGSISTPRLPPAVWGYSARPDALPKGNNEAQLDPSQT